MPETLTRLVGSGFTSFVYMGQPIAFLDEVNDTGQNPIVGYQAVTPLDAQYPVEFAVARVLTEGTLTLTIRELWNQKVWAALVGLSRTDNIVEIYNQQALSPNPITCALFVKKPDGSWRGKTYNNTKIVGVDDREQVAIGTLTFPRTITMVYAISRANVGAPTTPSAFASGLEGTATQPA